jgi:uncharacterized protein (DUF2267 family)
MTTTGFDAFDKTIHKTNALLKHIENELGWENQRNMSYAALRAVLHALRDRLTVQEAADLAEQFVFRASPNNLSKSSSSSHIITVFFSVSE